MGNHQKCSKNLTKSCSRAHRTRKSFKTIQETLREAYEAIGVVEEPPDTKIQNLAALFLASHIKPGEYCNYYLRFARLLRFQFTTLLTSFVPLLVI